MVALQEDRAIAAYLGLAIGDALGATVEFMTPAEIRAQYGLHRHIIGGGWLRLKPGQVTDDTGMSLALGNAILKAGKVDALAAAQAFDAWMRSKPVDMGNTVRRNLLLFRRTGQVEAPSSEHDAGNGAAMRVLPVALATLGQPEAAVRAASRAQAHVTHHNALSDAACECLIFMVQSALSGASKEDLFRWHVTPLLQAFPLFQYQGSAPKVPPSGYIVDTLRAVLPCVLETEDFESCLIRTVNLGGDADTTGALSGMLAGCLYGTTGIPRHWVQALDTHSRNACEQQARQLLTQEIQET